MTVAVALLYMAVLGFPLGSGAFADGGHGRGHGPGHGSGHGHNHGDDGDSGGGSWPTPPTILPIVFVGVGDAVINVHSDQRGEIFIRDGDFGDITTSNSVFGAILSEAAPCGGSCPPKIDSNVVFNGWSSQHALTVIEHASTGTIDASSFVAGAARIVTIPAPAH